MAKSVLSAPHFHNEEAAFAYVEALLWPQGPVCPHCVNCDGDRIGRLQGKSSRIGLRKCYGCRGTFTVRMGSIFEDSHLPLRLWLQVIHLMCASKKGLSTRQIQRMLQCSMKTAWHLSHRIREAMKDGHFGPLGGEGMTIEADETYIGGKEKNKHRVNRSGLRGGTGGKEAVLSLVERNGRVRSLHLGEVKSDNLRAVLVAQIDDASLLCTDEANHYRYWRSPFRHEVVNHSAEEYVRGPFHTNSVEGFFSILKRGINGCYFHVSEAHLHRYLAEFDFRYSNREKLGIDDAARADLAIKGFAGKRLTYQTTRFQT